MLVEWRPRAYKSEWRLFRDDLTRTVKGRYYYVPAGTPAFPRPHYLSSRDWIPPRENPPLYLGEAIGVRHGRDNGALPFPLPPAIAVGGPSCVGLSGLTTSLASLPLVGGIDPRCWTQAGLPVPPWAAPVLTPTYTPKVGEITDTWVDSPIHTDPTTGCVVVDTCMEVAGHLSPGSFDLPYGSVPDPPASGRYGLYVVLGGRVYAIASDGSTVPLLPGVAGYLPRSISTGDGIEPSRVYDPGTGPIVVGAPLDLGGPLTLAPGAYLDLPILAEAPAAPAAGYRRVYQTAEGLAALTSADEPTSPVECGWCGVDGGELTPAPGDDCAGAGLFEVDGEVPGELPAGPGEHWYYVELAPGTDYEIVITQLDGALDLDWYDTPDCGTIPSQTIHITAPGTYAWSGPAVNDRGYVQITDATDAGGAYEFRVQEA